MEHLLLRSKCSILHNIFKNLTFQRRPKALVWSKGLIRLSAIDRYNDLGENALNHLNVLKL